MIVTDNFDLQTISSQMDNSLQIIEIFFFSNFNLPDRIKKKYTEENRRGMLGKKCRITWREVV